MAGRAELAQLDSQTTSSPSHGFDFSTATQTKKKKNNKILFCFWGTQAGSRCVLHGMAWEMIPTWEPLPLGASVPLNFPRGV